MLIHESGGKVIWWQHEHTEIKIEDEDGIFELIPQAIVGLDTIVVRVVLKRGK